jgi:hypothetical protein
MINSVQPDLLFFVRVVEWEKELSEQKDQGRTKMKHIGQVRMSFGYY